MSGSFDAFLTPRCDFDLRKLPSSVGISYLLQRIGLPAYLSFAKTDTLEMASCRVSALALFDFIDFFCSGIGWKQTPF